MSRQESYCCRVGIADGCLHLHLRPRGVGRRPLAYPAGLVPVPLPDGAHDRPRCIQMRCDGGRLTSERRTRLRESVSGTACPKRGSCDKLSTTKYIVKIHIEGTRDTGSMFRESMKRMAYPKQQAILSQSSKLRQNKEGGWYSTVPRLDRLCCGKRQPRQNHS